MTDTFLDELDGLLARLENESPDELLARLNAINASDFEGVTDEGLARFGFGESLDPLPKRKLSEFAAELNVKNLGTRSGRIEKVGKEMKEVEATQASSALPSLDVEMLKWIGFNSSSLQGVQAHSFGRVKIISSPRPEDEFFSNLADSPPEFGPQEIFLRTATKDVAVPVLEVA